MGKFRKEEKKTPPPISTASLPDIVFMLLFFFMVSTVMRESELKIKKPTLPMATEIKKLEKKSLVSYIYVAPPREMYQSDYGTEPRIQLNDAISELGDIKDYIAAEREARDEKEVPFMTTSLKVDEYTKMGLVTDIKQALREVNALKLNYSARKKEVKN
jgi:biopolymer transport protein ExbD